ncbi:MAG: 3'-5' exonuclease [Bacteroidota bacterium]
MRYIIFDLEATCWKKREMRGPQEVIEVGAVMVDKKGEIIDEYEQMVRPKIHPILSYFCTELTTITQEMVDDAPYFFEVIPHFQDWIGIAHHPYCLCSWGFFDKKLLLSQSQRYGMDTQWLDTHISLKHQYPLLRGLTDPIGLKHVLKMEGFELTGHHHRGIDDARNTTKIFQAYLDRWAPPTSVGR